jgi:transcriptional regulator
MPMLYNPPQFAIEDLAAIHAHIRNTGLATLVTVSAEGPMASHLPLLLDDTAGPYGTLIGHLAHANPQIALTDVAIPALAVFMAADTYVSPSWYPAKQEHGRVVPTWNYATVHVRGALRFHDDPEWLRAAVERLTRKHEASFRQPWNVTDAPAKFIEAQLRGIVGVELEIAQLSGKYKLSQNRSEADRRGVIAGLAARPDGNAAEIARLMQDNLKENA